MDYLRSGKENMVLLCCILLALTSRLTVMAANGQCVDAYGKPVDNGAMFIPEISDPCTRCKCHNGFTIMCQAVICHPPHTECAKWQKTEGECCEYKCIDPHGLNPDLPGHDNSTIGDGATEDDSITNLGLRLVASTVTSFLVLALLLFMVHRLRQRRLLLAMRRFEAQSRRQQLEESESDQYIPDAYLGMIECPPYEDPPPPYSSPKPHPRILPGEAPPPYEEVDQNRNSHNNNNNTGGTTNQQPEELHNQGNVGQGGGQDERAPDLARQCHGQEERERAPEFVRRSLGRSEITERQMSAASAGRVRSVSPTRSSRNQSSPEEGDANGRGDCPESCHNNSLGRVSNSTDSTESHNCSCDSEQTLLKKTVPKVSSRTSQTLPPGFCLGQERSKGRKMKPQNSVQKMSQSCQGHFNHAADLSSSPANSSQSLPQDPNQKAPSQKYSSLPPTLGRLRSGQSDSAPVVTSAETRRPPDDLVALHHPLEEVSTSGMLASNPSSSSQMSQSCVILRDSKHNSQEQLRRSLPPLDFSTTASTTEAASTAVGETTIQPSDNQVITNNDYLRNVRLSNLLNSPIASGFDSPVSPASPAANPMQRSQSVNSEISVFSVCSETGEKRSTKQNGRVLRNDSQYPDIPISAHAMRMASLAHHSEGQRTEVEGQRTEVEGHASDIVMNDPLAVSSNCDDYQRTSDRAGKPKLNTVVEDRVEPAVSAIGLELRPDFQVLHNTAKETAMCKGHRSKRKDKHKQSRHSTGNMGQSKPKKHTHSSAGAILPSNCEIKRSEHHPGSSPNQVKKSTIDKNHTSPSKAVGSPVKTPSKSDPSKKKGTKPICDSYKQYGFIDDPGMLQSRNGTVELRLVNPDDDTVSPQILRKAGTQTEKSVLACVNKQAAQSKADRKRHLTNADKSSYSPSPTRQKSSRPRSFAHSVSQGHGEGSPTLGLDGSHSPSNGSPRRKTRNSRPKKRVSYPITGADMSSNPVGQYEDDHCLDRPSYPEAPNQEASSLPVGFITVRNGPLSSYV